MTNEDLLDDQTNEEMSQETISEPTTDADAKANDGLQVTVEGLTMELDEAKDKYLRLYADFDNFRKRKMKESLDLIKTASQDLIVSLLPILDDFERAKKASEDGIDAEFSEGVQLVFQKFISTLNNKGLVVMESTGEIFDPECHEAVTEMPAANTEMIGKVIDTLEKGYYLNDKIIRYAKVVVGK